MTGLWMETYVPPSFMNISIKVTTTGKHGILLKIFLSRHQVPYWTSFGGRLKSTNSTNGECIQCTSPARYAVMPGEETAWSDLLMKCSQTDWIEIAEQLFTGVGQNFVYRQP